MKEMPDLICGKAAVGWKYNSTHDIKLIKEPDNNYDKEAIRIELRGIGKIGYVANSAHNSRDFLNMSCVCYIKRSRFILNYGKNETIW